MSAKVDYEKDSREKEHENIANVSYNAGSKGQQFHNETGKKEVEKRCFVKYTTGAIKPSMGAGKMSTTSIISSQVGHPCKVKPSAKKSTRSLKSSQSSKSLSLTEIASKCYERKRGVKKSCTRAEQWQLGKYCRDDCGSGIVPKRFDFKPSRKLWCKTPLTLYQATVGELGRKILCREKVVPRDVRPPPPCNIAHYILPLCRGYYRKYECLRPCEEEHAVVKRGRKQYRDCIERYWEPCYSNWQKFKLDVNDYAPHNSVLMSKLRRQNTDGAVDIPCW